MQTFFFLVAFLSTLQCLSAQLTCSQSLCRFGECEQLEFDFRCHCDPGVKGILCDRLLKEGDNLCLSSPCWNGGVCKQIGNDFLCECQAGHSGKSCRTVEESVCLGSNPCQNNGICKPRLNNGFTCACVGDFTGLFCEEAIPLCLRKEPCLNGGTCSNNMCICTANFSGEFCQKFVNGDSGSTIQARTKRIRRIRAPVVPVKVLGDQKVVVFNKGGYVADLRVDYSLNVNGVLIPVRQSGSILVGQNYAFYIPGSIDLNSEPGAVLTVEAVGGVQVLRKKINNNPSCFHVWGTTLNPFWSSINC